MLNTRVCARKNLRFLAQTQNTTASSRFVEAAGGRCVHCFVRSTGVGISRTCSSQVRPRRVSPLARAVRRPLVDDRRPTLATRFVAEDAFSFFLPRGVRQYEPSASLFMRTARPRRARRVRRRVRVARAPRDARLATRLLRPRESDPLPRHAPPRLQSPRFAVKKQGKVGTSERRFRLRKGRTATSVNRTGTENRVKSEELHPPPWRSR
jgi:hypothetical protein